MIKFQSEKVEKRGRKKERGMKWTTTTTTIEMDRKNEDLNYLNVSFGLLALCTIRKRLLKCLHDKRTRPSGKLD